MKKKDDQLDQLFEKHEDQWDIQEISSNHEERFLNKLNSKKTKKNYFYRR